MSRLTDDKPLTAAEEISRLTDHLFRHESGRLVSVLTGLFGINHLQWAEDVVQEALIRALRTWPYRGIPQNPAAWLTQTAKNLALDLIRRESRFRDKQPAIAMFMEQWAADDGEGASSSMDGEIKDARLQLMFVCCHPLLPPEAQAALALKTLCGFSAAEIAKAFLTTEAAIAKRLTRARQRIREMGISYEIPESQELSSRLDGVLQTLYLLFNEGHNATTGEKVVREDLCQEAIRLVTLLVAHPAGQQPRAHALAALMFLNGARLPARVDVAGNILRLQDQNRSTWDQGMIAQGLSHLSESASGEDLSVYHIQAGISACHCTAPDYHSTDWPRILRLYDELLRLDHSPIVELNRAVALAQVHGPKAGLDAVNAIRKRRSLESYYLFHAVIAEFETQLHNFPAAIKHLQRALALTEVRSEKLFLAKKLHDYAP